MSSVRMVRKKAQDMREVMSQYIKSMNLSSGLNTQRVFKAWDDASGAGPFTIKRFYRDGKLFVTLNSSVVRSQLYMQKDAIIEKMNKMLVDDILFIKDEVRVSYVREIVLK